MWKNLLAALKAGTWAPALSALVTTAGTIGLVTATEASATTDVLGGVASLITLVAAAVHAFKGVQLVKAASAPKG
jgi:hypothetical protein